MAAGLAGPGPGTAPEPWLQWALLDRLGVSCMLHACPCYAEKLNGTHDDGNTHILEARYH